MNHVGGSDSKESACSAGDLSSVQGQKDPWRREWQPTPVFLPGESHGQRSLGTVHGVTKDRTQPSDQHFHFQQQHTVCMLVAHRKKFNFMERKRPFLYKMTDCSQKSEADNRSVVGTPLGYKSRQLPPLISLPREREVTYLINEFTKKKEKKK